MLPSDSSYAEILRQLELAADVMLAPPNQVSAAHRKEAETLIINVQESGVPLEFCLHALESTANHLVMFEISKALVVSMLKHWHETGDGEEKVEGVVKYLVGFCAARTSLPNYVASKLLQSAAMIIKRASLSTRILHSDTLFAETIERLLKSADMRLQSLGLLFVESLATEFSSTWSSSASGTSISWDFHTRAKKEFETVLLRRLMEMALASLSQLLIASDLSSAHVAVFDKFLRVSLLVLSWNFSPKLLTIRLRVLMSSLKTNSFRPPASWTALFHDTSIIHFFAQLHHKTRHNEELSANSMGCLAQLASVVGDVLSGSTEDLRLAAAGGDNGGGGVQRECHQLHDLYLQKFAASLIEFFAGGMLDHEMLPLSVVIYKLFTYHPILIFKRFPPELLLNFIQFISSTILRLSQPAMELALIKNDQTYHEALHNFYQVWRNLLRNVTIFADSVAQLINEQTALMVQEFMATVLAPPFGRRKAVSDLDAAEIVNENEEDEDDREVFGDLLADLGHLCLHRVGHAVPLIIEVLATKLSTFESLLAASAEQLRAWQEDLHWLLLVVGNCLLQTSFTSISNLPEELAQHCINGYKTGTFDASLNFESLINECLTNPLGVNPATMERLDPATRLSMLLFKWFVLEHSVFNQLGGEGVTDAVVSPELTRTSLWLYGVLIAALTPRPIDFEDSALEIDDGEAEELRLSQQLPNIPQTGSQLSARVIELALSKVFITLTKMSGEEKLCTQAIRLVITLSEGRAESLSTSDHLYALLGQLSLDNLPCRRTLLKSLVIIGSSVSSEEVRQRMYSMVVRTGLANGVGRDIPGERIPPRLQILEPLRTKFLALCGGGEGGSDPKALSGGKLDGQLADLFECFSGVADGGLSDAAPVLFSFLQPVFQAAAPLLRQRADSQLLVNAILEFVHASTDSLFFYIEDNELCSRYHNILLAVTEAYRDSQLSKYHRSRVMTSQSDEDQHTTDLITLIEILCDSVSKTFMPTYDGAGSVENSARVALLGLEFILPLMNESLLRVPALCSAFFRLLLFISDLAPVAMLQANEQMMLDFTRCVRMALENQFGVDHLRPCLEMVANMASFMCGGCAGVPPTVTAQLTALLDVVFSACLEHSCDVEIYNEASNALYALICLDREGFVRYAHSLTTREDNMRNQAQIEGALSELVPNAQLEMSRQERRLFHERMNRFLAEVNGVLCLS